MLFNSLDFIIFFPVVVFFYFLLPHRFRWILLLAASYIFYMWWKTEYLILILISTGVDYTAGIMMGKTDSRRKRRQFLLLSLVANLGLLFTFKYFNFFNGSVKALFDLLNVPYAIPKLQLLLPVGISFYTFQTLSYSIEVFRGNKKPERHLGKFALYVAFFPQLVAGPIERAVNLLPQFFEKKQFDYVRVTDGLKLMVWGFFKKIVIADNLAPIVNRVYNDVHAFSGVHYLLATFFFAFQIYCDFSGYSDIAIGGAQVMGFSLMNNFKRPYFAKSIAEFWRRWHISLSTWFRDYLYIPLGGNRVGKWRWYYNLFITFLISGLWHGSNWTFIVWGALHGFFLISSLATRSIRGKAAAFLGLTKMPALHRLLRIAVTFSLTCFAWIFFRSNSLADAFHVITHLHIGLTAFIVGSINDVLFTLNFTSIKAVIQEMGVTIYDFNVVVLSITFLVLIQVIQRRVRLRAMLSIQPLVIRWAIYGAAVLALFLFGSFTKQQFIYFQF